MITFKQINEKKIEIIKNNKSIGHIFSPAGSGGLYENAIQICGFSEAFDLWGCGPYNGFKDIQLLFDDEIMSGDDIIKDSEIVANACLRCFRVPCQCENTNSDFELPFRVKGHWELEKRLIKVKE